MSNLRDTLKTEILALMSAPHYMPVRKRALAKKLGVHEDEYADFRQWVDEWCEQGLLTELKRGKYGLPKAAREKLKPKPREKFDPDQPASERENILEEDAQAEEEDAVAETEEHELPAPQRRRHPHAEDEEDADDDEDWARTQRESSGGKRLKNTLQGRIQVTRSGAGFLLQDEATGFVPRGGGRERRKDLYIAPEDLGGAMNGDLVAVLPKQQRPRFNRHGRGGGGRPSGRVVKILERAHARIVGTYYELKPPAHGDPWPVRGMKGSLAENEPVSLGGYLVPDARGVFDELTVQPADTGGAQNGDKVLATLKDNRGRDTRPQVKIIEVFGAAGEARAEVRSIITNFSLREKFPDDVLAQANAMPPEVPAAELARRVDYTTAGQPITFTIDPEDAKDHDDAVGLRARMDPKTGQPNGWELLVHIADVSHYVQPGTPLDVEANLRATSVYLPGGVLPMLPPRLSGGLCSLKEGQVRLTKTVVMGISTNWLLDSVRIEKSFIRSAAFLTYDRVKAAVEADDYKPVQTPEILATLKEMRTFAAALRKKRMNDGSLDLDLPEVRLKLDEHGAVVGFETKRSHWAHELIEDMMLSANRAVANYLVDHALHGLFRVHEEPEEDALDKFADFAGEFGLHLKRPFDRFGLKKLLERTTGKPYQEAVHMALLTSLKQAVYSPICRPHYALNFSRYLHFTSPIRRYPDLIVHRSLDECHGLMDGDTPYKTLVARSARHKETPRAENYAGVAKMQALAVHCSKRERAAAQAEEEVKKVRLIQYLRANRREAHPGVITGVRDFGFFVRMLDSQLEGLVRVQDLDDDWYEYIEEKHLLQGQRRGRSFQLGDRVSVRVVEIDVGRRKVSLLVQ